MSIAWSTRLEALVLVAAKLARAESPATAVEIATVAGVAAIGGRGGAFTGAPGVPPRPSMEPPSGAQIVTVPVRTRESTNAALSAELPDEEEALPLLELLAALLAAALDCDARIGSLARAVGEAVAPKKPVPHRCPSRDPLRLLTARERAVFRLIIDGLSNEGVARELEISVKTVETHRAKINAKLDIHGPSELVRFAALRGLIAS